MSFICLIPKRLFYDELQQCKHTKGGQRMWFKDTLKSLLKEALANGRSHWRSITHKGAVYCEGRRTLAAEEKRQARKLRASIVETGDNEHIRLGGHSRVPGFYVKFAVATRHIVIIGAAKMALVEAGHCGGYPKPF